MPAPRRKPPIKRPRPVKSVAPAPEPVVDEGPDLEAELEAETATDMELIIGDDEDDGEDDGIDVDAPDPAGLSARTPQELEEQLENGERSEIPEPVLDQYEAAREARIARQQPPEPRVFETMLDEEGRRVVYMRVPHDFLAQIAEMNFVSRQDIFFFNAMTPEVREMAYQTAVQRLYKITIEEVNV